MQAQVNTNQKVGQVTELVALVGNYQKPEEKKYKHVLQKPIGHIGCTDKGIDPGKEKD